MNVIGSRPDGWWKNPDGAVHQLTQDLADFAIRSDSHVTVVFDRRPPGMRAGRRGGGLTVAFARTSGRDAADREIARRVSLEPDPAAVTVVTSDRALAAMVKELGARVEPAGRWRERLDRS